jgi:hypothetical protein
MPIDQYKCLEIDCRGLSVPVAARLVEELTPLGGPELVVLLAAGDPSLTAQVAARLRSADIRICLVLAADQITAHRETLLAAWACRVAGTVGEPALSVLLGAHRRRGGLLVEIEPRDRALDSQLDQACVQLPPAAARVGSDGSWRDATGRSVDVREALAAEEAFCAPMTFVVAYPTKDGTAYGVWAGGTMAMADWMTQSEGHAVLGFDNDPTQIQAWIDAVAPTKRLDVQFQSFPVAVWFPQPWDTKTPTAHAQCDLVVAAAWMLLGRWEDLEQALGLAPGRAEQIDCNRSAEFIVEAIRVAALSRGQETLRRRVAGALREIGHAEARRASTFLRTAHPEIGVALGKRDSAATRNRIDGWRAGRDRHAQLRRAVRVACGLPVERGQ